MQYCDLKEGPVSGHKRALERKRKIQIQASEDRKWRCK
jgi:hypothetical protein